MDYRILGPLEVTHDGVEVPLGSRKQRAVLAILLLRANEVVSSDVLIDELWGEDPPPSAAHTLQVYVSRLRKALRTKSGPENTLITRPGGYLLRVGFGELDLHRFERLADEGRRAFQAGSFDRAAEKLAEALSLWRGPALTDLAFEPFARVDIERLNEQRLSVLEEQIEASLALGRHAESAAELESLVAKHPLRERLRGQLMLALYRCGRQADALGVYRDGCEYLREEMGLEPSKDLQQLQGAILRQDDSLELRAPQAADSLVVATAAREGERFAVRTGPESVDTPRDKTDEGAKASGPRSGTRATRDRDRALIAKGALVITLVAALLGAIVAFRGDGDDPVPASSIPAGSAGFIDPRTHTIVGQTTALGRPTSVAAGGGDVWVTDPAGNQLLRLDAATLTVVDRIPVGQSPTDVAVAEGSVWVVDAETREVYEINPDTGTVVATVSVGNGPTAVAADAGALWVADAIDGTVIRIDPSSARVTATIRVAQPLGDVAVGLGSVWATSPASGLLVRVDPDSNRVIQTFAAGNGPNSVAIAGDAVWVANPPDATISRIDPSTGKVRKVDVPDPGAMTSVGNQLWVAEPNRLELAIVHPEERAVIATVPIGSSPAALAPTGRTLAVVTAPAPAAHRGGVLRVVAGRGLDSIDPGSAWSAIGWTLSTLTNDGLLRYARAPGPAGAAITPDLATAVPAPQAGDRLFTFVVRRDVRYSTGEPVRPEDFRTAIERQYVAGTGLAALGVPLAGAERCADRAERCDLSRGISIDDDSSTITFHLTSPDPTFLHKLALPFASPLPGGVPPIGSKRPLPATGEYAIERYSPGREVVLVRNPFFRPSPANPEAGFADRITMRLGLDPKEQLAAVEAGAADLMLDNPPSAELERLARLFPHRLHTYTLPEVHALFLNTRLPPFDRLAARRALNFATHRGAVVRLAGGTEFARPTCQILTSGLPGYKPFCPYTEAPGGEAGLWQRPDPARARRLIARSGTSRMPVTVSTVADDPYKLKVGRYAVELLERLGYRARLRLYPGIHPYYARVGLAKRGSQVGVFGWQADYPAGSALFKVLFSCESYRPAEPFNSNPAGFCDRGVDEMIRNAASLEATNPAASAALWRRVDRQVTLKAPWVPLVNFLGVDFVSERVGNYQRSPAFGVLLDRLWVR